MIDRRTLLKEIGATSLVAIGVAATAGDGQAASASNDAYRIETGRLWIELFNEGEPVAEAVLQNVRAVTDESGVIFYADDIVFHNTTMTADSGVVAINLGGDIVLRIPMPTTGPVSSWDDDFIVAFGPGGAAAIWTV